VVRAEGLETFYGDIQALWGVSFEVGEGEIVTLLGSNGAGKTTAIRTVCGALRPRSGTVTFCEERIDRLPPHEIVGRGLVHVPEGRKLWPYLSVEDNLVLGAYPGRARPGRAKTLRWVFDLFPILAERRRQLAGTLSGGEQQMLAVGRGLMSAPRVLMLDEPSLGLAPLVVAEVFRAIQEINRAGVAIVLVEQNVTEALKIAHRGYVLETGKVTLQGSSPELLGNPFVQQTYLGL
jgi:branched-chain amino acid transport system ATP-binding protein